MALDKSVLDDLPEHGIAYKKVSGKTYVYDLKNMQEPPDKKLRYDKYFFINRSKDGKLAFKRNDEAIDARILRCGFFLIAETDYKKINGGDIGHLPPP